MSDPRRGSIEPARSQEGASDLRIVLPTGARPSTLPRPSWRALPGAQCVNAWTGQSAQPESVPDELTARAVEKIAPLLLQLRWGDGPQTGIYSFRLLRELAKKNVNRES